MNLNRREVKIGILLFGLAVAAAAIYFAWQVREAPVSPTENVPPTWAAARTSPMHAAHVGREKIACTKCHADGFTKKADTASCGPCHEKADKKPHLAQNACLTCHAFTAKLATPTCVDCHVAGADPKAKKVTQHARADVACTSCHHPHGDEKGRLADCTVCHQGVSAAHGSFAVAARTDDAGVEAGAMRDASAALIAFAAGTPKNAPPGQVCTACHAPHASKQAALGTCAATACHAPMATAVRGDGHTGGHQACSTCHEPHRARKADVKACDGCHAERKGAFAIKAHEKASCTGCHAPHAASGAEATAACARCHAAMTALAAPKVKDHAACTSCHDVHQPSASPALACAKCHAAKVAAHPAAKSGAACTGCHEPHPKKPDVVVATCSSCHTKAKNDHGFHAAKTECTSCHKPHVFALAKTTTTGAAGGAFCARCHAQQGSAVAARSGHAECRACHGEPHAPDKKPGCQACHAQEVATAPKGHAACGSCHDSHSGSLGTHAACASCHADKPKTLHGNQDCKSCHRPHGPKGLASPPACVTCHAPAKLPGLHAAQSHAAKCASCHSSHAPPRPDRATCTTNCHLDRKNHQPEAKVCNGCHVFRN